MITWPLLQQEQRWLFGFSSTRLWTCIAKPFYNHLWICFLMYFLFHSKFHIFWQSVCTKWINSSWHFWLEPHLSPYRLNQHTSPVRTVICPFTLDGSSKAAVPWDKHPIMALSRAPQRFIAALQLRTTTAGREAPETPAPVPPVTAVRCAQPNRLEARIGRGFTRWADTCVKHRKRAFVWFHKT